MRFHLIDRITRMEAGRGAEAVKNVALSEDFFDDHFPRHPVMPGVLILEGLAQLSGVFLEATLAEREGRNAWAVLSMLERTKFLKIVRPGDTLVYEVELVGINGQGGKTSARAMRGGEMVASTTMVFGFNYECDPGLQEKREAVKRLWMGEA